MNMLPCTWSEAAYSNRGGQGKAIELGVQAFTYSLMNG